MSRRRRRSTGMTFIAYFLYIAGLALVVLSFVVPLNPWYRFNLFTYMVEPNVLRVFTILVGLGCIVTGFAVLKRMFVGFVALVVGMVFGVVMDFCFGDATGYAGGLVDIAATVYVAGHYREFLPPEWRGAADPDSEGAQ